MRFCRISHNMCMTPRLGDVDLITHDYAIVLSQDCDLLWDFNRIEQKKISELTSVLFYELETVPATKARLPGSDILRRILDTRDERYQLLQSCPKENDLELVGIPDLIVDFKRFFCVPPREVYRQCREASGAARRCKLEMPYREHLQSRAAFYLQRVGLPEPHKVAGP